MDYKASHIAMCNVELIYVGQGLRRVLKDTLCIFRDACKLVGGVVEAHWDEVSACSGKEKLNCVEHLIHKTKDNIPVYPEFDEQFYKFPSYYRRSAINYCLGQASSYYTRMEDYQTRRKAAIDNGKKFREKPPVLNWDTAACPAMYKEQMYSISGGKVFLKVFIRNTWDWVEVALPGRDRKDLETKAALGKLMSPSLVYKYHKFYLAFPIEYKGLPFPETRLQNRKIIAVDLGVNRGATVCVMDASGTILGRYFDPFTSERDRMDHLINKIRKLQRQTGAGNSLSAVYTKLEGIKHNYACQLSRWITDIAAENGAYGVVLEHLGKMRGSKSARIHHWCKCRIRDFVKGMCFRLGIRVFTINPRNTSALAYDGSGKVTRGEYRVAGGEIKYNYSVCTFASGKQYNCDLNASYNIGARYFLREFQKSMDETQWSQLTAEVPGLAKRTMSTLSTLWAFHEANAVMAA